jgi:hypothetical protein
VPGVQRVLKADTAAPIDPHQGATP